MLGNIEVCVWFLLWDRECFLKCKYNVNYGVDFLVYGYNFIQVCLWIGNLYYIDIGRYGYFMVINLFDIIEVFKKFNIN